MALSIKDDETDALVRKLAIQRKLNFTAAIRLAVSNELARDAKPQKDVDAILANVRKIQDDVARLPVLDDRPMDELLGYDDYGLPT